MTDLSFQDYAHGLGHVSQGFNSNYDMAAGIMNGPHHAYDIAPMQKGASPSIPAFRGGTVLEAQSEGPLGDHVVIQGADGNRYTYGHLMERNVKPGDVINSGDQIGLMGTTGKSTGNHVHFQVNGPDGSPIDSATAFPSTSPMANPSATAEQQMPDAYGGAPEAPPPAAAVQQAPQQQGAPVPADLPPFMQNPGSDQDFRSFVEQVRGQLDDNGHQKIPDHIVLLHIGSRLEPQFPGISAKIQKGIQKLGGDPTTAPSRLLGVMAYGDPLGGLGSQKALQQHVAMQAAMNPSLLGVPTPPDPNVDPQTGQPYQTQIPGANAYEAQQGGWGTILHGAANASNSLVNTSKQFLGAALHPLDTIGNMAKVGVGGAQRAYEGITGNKAPDYQPEGVNPAGAGNTNEEQAFDSFAKGLKQRYGSVDAIRKTMFEDPTGFLRDIAAVATPLQKGLDMAGVPTEYSLPSMGSAKPDLAGLMKQYGSVDNIPLDKLDPEEAARVQSLSPEDLQKEVNSQSAPEKPGMIQGMADKAAKKLISEYIKPAAKEMRFGKDPAGAVVREGIVAASPEGLQKAIGAKMDEIGPQISETVDRASEENPQTIDMTPHVMDPIDEAMKKAQGGPNTAANPELYKQLQGVKNNLTQDFLPNENGDLESAGAKTMTGNQSDLLEMKRSVQSSIKWDQTNPFNNELNKVKWQIFNNLGNELEKQVPEITDLNKRYSDMAAAKVSIDRRLPVLERASKMPLGTTIRSIGAAGTTLAATGNLPLALSAGAADFLGEKALNSTLLKTGGAQLLSGAPGALKSGAVGLLKTGAVTTPFVSPLDKGKQ